MIKILNSDATPRQIAMGVAMGSFFGLTPLFSIHNFIILFLLFILNLSIGSAIVATILFWPLEYFLGPLYIMVGEALLIDNAILLPLWELLYNIPLFPFTRFNNTYIIGAITTCVLLWFPIFFIIKWGVKKYRDRLREAFINSAFYKIISKLKIVSIIGKLFIT